MAAKLKKKYRDKFAGGVNSYLGVRQIKDDESPDMVNCDFKGEGGIGNRDGYTEIGTPATYTSGVYGTTSLHTSAKHQLIKFASNGSNIVLAHSTDGGAWTNVTGTTFTDSLNIDSVQAKSNIYVSNGTDVMREWDGSAWSDTTNGTKGFYTTYYNHRLWVVDETNPSYLNFSGQWGAAGIGDGGTETDKLGDFSDATAGFIAFKFGSGAEITGLRVFRNALYVFLRDSIYSVVPASAANTFTITQVTNAVGCVSHRSIDQVQEDLYFASDSGVFSLGEVANYALSIRSTEKSGKIQQVFTNLTSANKGKLVGKYFNFKYHLFYSLFGTNNDSVVAYDTRYGGWVDWRNISANDAVKYTDSTNAEFLHFGHPTNSEVHKMYKGTTDDGTAISSYFTTKSFDEKLPDILKVYFDHTFVFGAITGSVTITVIFDDSLTASTATLTQTSPQGGFGRDAFGVKAFGDASNTVTVTSFIGAPQRMTVSDQKFAVQYKIASSGSWRLDDITTTYKPLNHYAFPSGNKLN